MCFDIHTKETSKYRTHYIRNLRKNISSQLSYIHSCKSNYIQAKSEDMILYNYLKLIQSTIPWNNDLNAILKHLEQGKKYYVPYEIETSGDSPKYYTSENTYKLLWKDVKSGRKFTSHNKDFKLSISECQEVNKDLQSGYGENFSNNIYDEVSKTLYTPQSINLNKFAIKTFDVCDKHIDNKQNEFRNGTGTNYVPISELTKNDTKLLKMLRNESFIGELAILRNPKCKSYSDLEIAGYNDSTKVRMTHKSVTGYALKDLILILDLDTNENNINKVIDCLYDKALPFVPQMIIKENGINKAKKGHASAVYFFTTPVNKEQRKLILTALQLWIKNKLGIIAIDSAATGIGMFKNPFQQYKGKNIRNTYFAITYDSMLFAHKNLTQVVIFCHNYIKNNAPIPLYVVNYIKSHKLECEVKSYNELEKLAQNEKQIQVKTKYDNDYNNCFLERVENGYRHNTLVTEIAISLLQYYNHRGLEILKNYSPAYILSEDIAFCKSNKKDYEELNISLFEAIWQDVQNRYDLNCNDEIDENVVYQICFDRVSKDIQNVNTEDKEFYSAMWYQHNIMKKYKCSHILDILGFEDKEIKNLYKDVTFVLQFDSNDIPISIKPDIVKTEYNKMQSHRGGNTKYIYSIFNSLYEYSENINESVILISNALVQMIKNYNVKTNNDFNINKTYAENIEYLNSCYGSNNVEPITNMRATKKNHHKLECKYLSMQYSKLILECWNVLKNIIIKNKLPENSNYCLLWNSINIKTREKLQQLEFKPDNTNIISESRKLKAQCISLYWALMKARKQLGMIDYSIDFDYDTKIYVKESNDINDFEFTIFKNQMLVTKCLTKSIDVESSIENTIDKVLTTMYSIANNIDTTAYKNDTELNQKRFKELKKHFLQLNNIDLNTLIESIKYISSYNCTGSVYNFVNNGIISRLIENCSKYILSLYNNNDINKFKTFYNRFKLKHSSTKKHYDQTVRAIIYAVENINKAPNKSELDSILMDILNKFRSIYQDNSEKFSFIIDMLSAQLKIDLYSYFKICSENDLNLFININLNKFISTIFNLNSNLTRQLCK